MKKILQEFKQFAMRGNVIDMAVGIIIGGAFGKIVSSVVGDIIMPAIGLLIAGVNFTDLKIVLKQAVMPSLFCCRCVCRLQLLPSVCIRYKRT